MVDREKEYKKIERRIFKMECKIESIDDELYFSTISEVSLKGAVSNPILPGELERMNPKSIWTRIPCEANKIYNESE